MALFRYGMRMRPPGPGAQPKNGLVRVYNEIHGIFWGILDYDRRLSVAEQEQYSMMPLGVHEDDVNDEEDYL